MIAGIGIDSVEIARFNHWATTYTYATLRKTFSDHEIIYCLQEANKTAQRFAVRFAAKEAAYKALCSATGQQLPFLTMLPEMSIELTNGIPAVVLPAQYQMFYRSFCSLTHTETTATAVVVLEFL